MRSQLLYNPRVLFERVAQFSFARRRLKKLQGTPAQTLRVGHIDSLELLELLKDTPPEIIYDVGANVGTWTVLAKSIFPKSQVHAFEPLDQLSEEFFKRTRGLGEVYRHPVALGSSAGTASMKLTDFIDASSLLDMTPTQVSHYHVHPAGETAVQVKRLDDYCREKSLPRPDLIKLDIQGYELEALRGADECLKSTTAIVTEVSFLELYEKQCLFHDVVQFLAAQGFGITAFGAQTALGCRVFQSDVLFERL
jgi:FkbM family methyltransferase